MILSTSKRQKTTSLSSSNHCSVIVQRLANRIDAERSRRGEGKPGRTEPLASVIGVSAMSSGSNSSLNVDVEFSPTDGERSRKELLYDGNKPKDGIPREVTRIIMQPSFANDGICRR